MAYALQFIACKDYSAVICRRFAMSSIVKIFIADIAVFTLSACSKKDRDDRSSIEPASSAVVVIYGSINNDKYGNIYYGEDTRGKMYVIEKGKFILDLITQPVHFVKIA